VYLKMQNSFRECYFNMILYVYNINANIDRKHSLNKRNSDNSIHVLFLNFLSCMNLMQLIHVLVLSIFIDLSSMHTL